MQSYDSIYHLMTLFLALFGTFAIMFGTTLQYLRYLDEVNDNELIKQLIGKNSENPQVRLLFLGAQSRQAKGIIGDLTSDAREAADDLENVDRYAVVLAQNQASEAARRRAIRDLTDLRSWLLLSTGACALFLVAVFALFGGVAP